MPSGKSESLDTDVYAQGKFKHRQSIKIWNLVLIISTPEKDITIMQQQVKRETLLHYFPDCN